MLRSNYEGSVRVMPRTIQPPADGESSKPVLTEKLTLEEINALLAEAKEVDAFFQMTFENSAASRKGGGHGA
jgi:hypothetical protein